MSPELVAKKAEAQGTLRGLIATGKIGFVSSSFQPQSLPLLHMVSEIEGLVDVCLTDTGFLFPETISFAEDVCQRFELNLIKVRPEVPKLSQLDKRGAFLYGSDPDSCCRINKVAPLRGLMNNYDFWVNGVRADQSQARADLKKFEVASARCTRYHPMLTWTSRDIWLYAKHYELPEHPLTDQGYQSIGCEPCTVKWAEEGNERNSRWFGLNKSECGLNTDLIATGST